MSVYEALLKLFQIVKESPQKRCQSGAHTLEKNCDCWIGRPKQCYNCGILCYPDNEMCMRPCPKPDARLLELEASYKSNSYYEEE